MNSPSILVNVWFDVRCPWCFIGKRRLERAVEIFYESEPSIPVVIQHHSFELAPSIPERFEGTEADYLMKYEGVPLEHSARALPELQRLAAAEDVDLRFEELQQANTRRAHRVFQYGKAQGLGEELLERLFLAYFTECRDMADSETLAELAAGVGLDRAAALAAAESEYGDPWDEAVGKDHVRGQMLGAAGVPFALVNAKYRISGAQSADIFAEALREVVRRDFGPDASR